MLECQVLTTENEVDTLKDAWHALFQKVGVNPLSDYGSYKAWWDGVARSKGATPLVIAGWREGRLVGLLPFVIRPKGKIRILFVAGYDVFLGAMDLLEDPADMEDMWQVLRHSRLYDVAEIKYVRPESSIQKIVKTFPLSMVLEKTITSMAHLESKDSEEWYNKTLGKDRRNNLRRGRKKLEEIGKVEFKVYTDTVPEEVVQKAIEHRRAWCLQFGMDSFIIREDSYIKGLVRDASAHGVLRFFCLSCGEKPIGFCIGFTRKKYLLYYLIAHDAAFNHYSAGFLTTTLVCRWAVDNGFEFLDFMAGREAYKSKLSNVREPVESYLFCRSPLGFIGWLALAARSKKDAINRWLHPRNEQD